MLKGRPAFPLLPKIRSIFAYIGMAKVTVAFQPAFPACDVHKFPVRVAVCVGLGLAGWLVGLFLLLFSCLLSFLFLFIYLYLSFFFFLLLRSSHISDFKSGTPVATLPGLGVIRSLLTLVGPASVHCWPVEQQV